MVSGDIVNELNSVISTALIFRPAVGVEVLVSSVGALNNKWSLLYNGTIFSHIVVTPGAATDTGANVKIFINNTNYLNVEATAGFYNSFTGVQIK